jgi:transposase
MKNTAKSMEQLENKCAQLEQQVAELSVKLSWYEEQFRLSQKRRFGSSSEQTHPDQMQIFNEAEAEAKPSLPEPEMQEVAGHRRKKQVGKREAQLENLPVEIIEYTLQPEEQLCACCGGNLHEMSTEVRQEIKIIPAQVSVTKHVRHVYACRQCEREGTESTIITAPMPAPPLPGSIASPTAMSFIMTQKFVDGLPLYRQEQQLARHGIELSRQTMANWMVQGSERWLYPLYERMHEHLLRQDVLHADESTLQVLREPGRSAESMSYMWLYRTGRDVKRHIIAKLNVKLSLTTQLNLLQINSKNARYY